MCVLTCLKSSRSKGLRNLLLYSSQEVLINICYVDVCIDVLEHKYQKIGLIALILLVNKYFLQLCANPLFKSQILFRFSHW